MRLYDIFNEIQAMRQRLLGHVSASIIQLGMLLRKGMPLAEALYRVSLSSASQRLKVVAGLAARRLASGEGCDKVFAGSDMAIFPAAARYILASPLKDETKGRLIADWKYRHRSSFRFESALVYPVVSLCMAAMTSLALYMFVFPQMREIFMGLKVKGTPFVDWMLYRCGGGWFLWDFAFVVAFVFLLQLVVYVSRRISRFPQKVDEMNLLRMLAVLPLEERVQAIDVMSVKYNFPALHERFRRFARSLRAGSDIGSAGKESGVSDMLTWFVVLGLHEENSEVKLLDEAADYFNASVESSVTKTVSMIEVTSTLFLAAVFGSTAYALMQMMTILTESMFT